MADVVRRPEEMFELKSFTKDNQPIGGLSKFEDVKGRILKVTRRAGDAIHADDMYAETDPAWGVSTHLPKGYRAVGLRVSLEGSLSGWATLPLSRVDVIDTVRRGDDKSSYSHFLLENVLVLAIDGQSIRDEAGKPMPGNVVMFALSPDDCLRLSVARDTGTLTLALRNVNDTDKSGAGLVTLEHIRNFGHNPAVGEEAPAEANTGTSPIGQSLSSLPVIDRAAVQPAVEAKVEPKGPEGTAHRLVVREGTSSTTAHYVLDRFDHPIESEERK
jgi:Flp pilus assembly protein CpaB